MKAEPITGPLAEHGEGPVWDPAAGRLRYVDMNRGDLLTLHSDGSVERWHLASVAAAWRPRTDGGMVVGVERGFALADAQTRTIEALPEVWSDPGVRMNDGACDPQGRFYCGSMAYDERPGAGALYRLDPDLSWHTVLTDVTISNGLHWLPDGTAAYYNDTPTQEVAILDFDPEAGRFTGRRVLAQVDGHPDGLTVDADGAVWTALFGGAAVHRYLPDGTLDAVIDLPTPNVTACAFGGPDYRTLFITTSKEGLDGSDPLAGSVFAVEPGVAGTPPLPFAG
jgi:sugar lactone lactonase YvrE